uniref:TSA: Wollemia nobilis Ref_Wollemi_Transcript_14873_2386 transcribed RNA sequence n=1 Tax=Wollemia nobilis TaxID=56998 RepID=A0A0C9QPF4_9CONI
MAEEADLENLLLEAAGRTAAHDGKQNNRARAPREASDSFSDDGSDSNFDNEDDSDDAGTTNRKSSGSRMPLKKRFDSGDKDNDDRGCRDDSDSDCSIRSDLYKDDEDRENLGKMSELQREMILAERAEVRENYLMRKRAEARQNENRNKRGRDYDRDRDTGPPSSRMRSSVKSTRSVKENALNELVARRQKAQDSDMQRKRRDTVGSSRGRDSSPGRRRSRASPSVSPPSSSNRDRSPSSRGDFDESDGDGPDSADIPTFEDIKSITIRRSKLAKWFMEPFFEKIIVGCFVRVGIGMTKQGQRVYRLCMVKNVDATEPEKAYKFENRITHKYLNVVWGDNSARWQMERVSDQPPLEKEFVEWEREVERNDGRMITRSEIEEKRNALQEINNFVYSAETVKQMLQEKKMASSRPLNVALEKDRLRKEMELAESRHDYSEVERIKSKLKDLDVLSQRKSKDSKAQMLAEMNKKNKIENFKNASMVKPVNLNLKAGEAGYDPFSRRWTRSQNYYNAKNTISEANKDANKESDAVEAGEAATAAALEAAAGAGKLVDTEAPVAEGTKLFNLHDFELPISLAGLQKYGGAQGVHMAFLARKQRIEATMGVQVPSDDGRRHMMTLTVTDYKRRRGLL